MKLVNACKKDLNEVLTLHQKLFDYEYTYDNYLYEIDHEIANFMILKNDDEVVGYFIVHSVFETMEIVVIAVDKKYQHKGYGQFLLKYIDYLTIKNGCSEILLEVSHYNEKAINFYKSNDFIEIAKRYDYYFKDNHALILRKQV